MSTAETSDKPTVEELLVSIRKAIHGNNAARASLDTASTTVPETVPRKAAVHQFAPRNTLAERVSARKRPVSTSLSEMRVKLKADDRKKSTTIGGADDTRENFSKLRRQLHDMGATTRARATSTTGAPANGFANILSGHTRLEDALEKLRTAGLEPAKEDTADTTYADTDAIDENPADFRFSDYDELDGDFDEFDTQEPVQEPQPDDSGGFSATVRDSYLNPPAAAAPVPPIPQSPATAQPAQSPATFSAMVPPAAPQAQAQSTGQSEADAAALTSPQSAQATNAAFNKLAEAIVAHSQTGSQSIDQMTRELLRPMLKSWLDENLPRLAERLVRDEIERVARGGGK